MKNKKGFTLIELIAVIVIMGVLFLVAVPAVTKELQSSRKKTYISIASGYIDAVKNMITNRTIVIRNTSKTYYIPYECIETDSGGKTPYGKIKEAYVVVSYENSKYSYFWTSIDESNTGILLTSEDALKEDVIYASLDKEIKRTVNGRTVIELDKTIPVNGKNEIFIMDKVKCDMKINDESQTPMASSKNVNNGETLTPEILK